MTDSVLSSADSFLKDFALDFKLKYATKIAGRTDAIYSTLYTALGKDNERLSFLKSQRARTLTAIDTIEASQPEGPDRTKAVAKARIEFVHNAISALKYANPTGSARDVASALTLLSKELSSATQDYVTALGGTIDSAGQDVLSNAAKAVQYLRGLVTKQRGILAAAPGVRSDLPILQAKNALNATQAAIDSTASFTVSSATASGGVNITV